ILQNLDAKAQLLVTLNPTTAIDPDKVIRRVVYQHPVYTPRGIAAQRRSVELMGRQRSFYCGAWLGYGFHEDGVKSGLAAADAVRAWSNNEQLPLLRAG